jgi:hypothetical protein
MRSRFAFRGMADCVLALLAESSEVLFDAPSITASRKDHSITSSAATSNAVGTVRPSALAVLRLMISSIFVCC